jgi:hypothetical protein
MRHSGKHKMDCPCLAFLVAVAVKVVGLEINFYVA